MNVLSRTRANPVNSHTSVFTKKINSTALPEIFKSWGISKNWGKWRSSVAHDSKLWHKERARSFVWTFKAFK